MKKFCAEISPFLIGIILLKLGVPLWTYGVAIVLFILALPVLALRDMMSIPPEIKQEPVKIIVDTNSKEYLARFMPKA